MGSSCLKNALTLMVSPVMDDTGSCKSVMAGLSTIFVIGTIIGSLTPKNEELTPPYRTISASIGWIYFMAWSISFYPQTMSNYKRKRTDGLSTDFCMLNVLGFSCYACYNASFYWSETIHKEYKDRYGPESKILVQSNDVAFSIHALILSSITLFQIAYYGGGIRSIKLSKQTTVIIFIILGICIVYPLLIVVDPNGHYFNWLDYLYTLSFVKIFISLIKYIPQVILNYRRKSTVGWSVWNILLDFTGGILSDLQLFLDCINLNDFRSITRNLAKFGLGWLSIMFDVLFMIQHYFLYNSSSSTAEITTMQHSNGGQNEPLLPPSPVIEPQNDNDNDNSGGSSGNGIEEECAVESTTIIAKNNGGEQKNSTQHQQQPETIFV